MGAGKPERFRSVEEMPKQLTTALTALVRLEQIAEFMSVPLQDTPKYLQEIWRRRLTNDQRLVREELWDRWSVDPAKSPIALSRVNNFRDFVNNLQGLASHVQRINSMQSLARVTRLKEEFYQEFATSLKPQRSFAQDQPSSHLYTGVRAEYFQPAGTSSLLDQTEAGLSKEVAPKEVHGDYPEEVVFNVIDSIKDKPIKLTPRVSQKDRFLLELLESPNSQASRNDLSQRLFGHDGKEYTNRVSAYCGLSNRTLKSYNLTIPRLAVGGNHRVRGLYRLSLINEGISESRPVPLEETKAVVEEPQPGKVKKDGQSSEEEFRQMITSLSDEMFAGRYSHSLGVVGSKRLRRMPGGITRSYKETGKEFSSLTADLLIYLLEKPGERYYSTFLGERFFPESDRKKAMNRVSYTVSYINGAIDQTHRSFKIHNSGQFGGAATAESRYWVDYTESEEDFLKRLGFEQPRVELPKVEEQALAESESPKIEKLLAELVPQTEYVFREGVTTKSLGDLGYRMVFIFDHLDFDPTAIELAELMYGTDQDIKQSSLKIWAWLNQIRQKLPSGFRIDPIKDGPITRYRFVRPAAEIERTPFVEELTPHVEEVEAIERFNPPEIEVLMNLLENRNGTYVVILGQQPFKFELDSQVVQAIDRLKSQMQDKNAGLPPLSKEEFVEIKDQLLAKLGNFFDKEGADKVIDKQPEDVQLVMLSLHIHQTMMQGRLKNFLADLPDRIQAADDRNNITKEWQEWASI